MRGKIIAIEGIDGSGKNTQARCLVDALSNLGREVKFFNFPYYNDTFFGREIGLYLNGQFGGIKDLNPKFPSLLYAGDRLEKKLEIISAIERGCDVVIDRYVSSNVAHQAGKVSGPEREVLTNWIETLEYQVFGVPQPNLTLFLDVPPEFSRRMVLTKAARTYTNKKEDIHEENFEYLSGVYVAYKELALRHDWYTVNCVSAQSMRGIKDISDEVLNYVLENVL